MKYWCYNVTKLVCWLVFRIGFGLDVRGQEHVPSTGPFILASNHVSFLDPPLVGVACPRPVTFMARADLFHHRALDLFLRGVRVIALARDEPDLGGIRRAVARLRDGEGVGIFPEGGRQLSGRLGRAKRGVGLLAELAQAPIIPVLVSGTYEALPPQATRLHRAKIRVAFGPPIPYTDSPVFPVAESQHRPDEDGPRRERSPSRDRHLHLAEVVTQAWRRLEQQLHDTRVRA